MDLGRKFSFIFLPVIGVLTHSINSAAQVCKAQDSLHPIKQIAVSSCEETKKSAECQALYKDLEQNGSTVSDFALNCQMDRELSASELQNFQIGGCALGGLKTVVNILRLPAVAGRAIGETTAKAVLALEADADRQKECDKNPDRKSGVYQVYNANVPALLQIPIPDQNSLERKSCAQVETDFYHAKNQKIRLVSQKYDYKLIQKSPTVTADEKEYLEWKLSSPEFAARDDGAMTRMVDQALREYDIKIQCYNVLRRMALRCETYSNLALLGGLGIKGISFLAGVRTRQMSALAGQAARTESVEVIHWLNNSHFDILVNGKIYNLTAPGAKAVRKVNPKSFEAWGEAGKPATRMKIAVTPEELAEINASAEKLALMKWGPAFSSERAGQLYTRFSNGQGLTCSGSVCAILDSATKISTAPFHVPQVLRISPTFTAAYIRGMSALGNPRVLSIETTGNINLAKYAKSQEVLTGAGIAASYVVIEYLGPDGKSKKIAVPADDKK